jgi:phosphatidylglycerophosphate synthase
MIDGRKLPRTQANTLDTVVLDAINKLAVALHRCVPEITPNIITTFGNAARFTGVYLLASKQCPELMLALTVVGIASDMLDGHVARKYNMVTSFGDKYDHYSDWLWGATVGIVLLTQYSIPGYLWSLFLVAFFFYNVYFGCQESLYANQEESKSIEFTQYFPNLLGGNYHDIMQILRKFMGCTIMGIILCALMYSSMKFY